MSRMHETKCDCCGKKIFKRVADQKRYKHKYCSLKCLYINKTTRVTLQCEQCGKDIIKRWSQIKKTEHDFCSRSCATIHRNKRRTGKNHPSYIDGSSCYRSNALEYYGAYCHNPDCELNKLGLQIPKKMLDVHHIDGNRSNTEFSNLDVLCIWCHVKHTRLKEYEFSYSTMKMLHAIPTTKAPHGEYYVMSEPGWIWYKKRLEVIRRHPELFRTPITVKRQPILSNKK